MPNVGIGTGKDWEMLFFLIHANGGGGECAA